MPSSLFSVSRRPFGKVFPVPSFRIPLLARFLSFLPPPLGDPVLAVPLRRSSGDTPSGCSAPGPGVCLLFIQDPPLLFEGAPSGSASVSCRQNRGLAAVCPPPAISAPLSSFVSSPCWRKVFVMLFWLRAYCPPPLPFIMPPWTAVPCFSLLPFFSFFRDLAASASVPNRRTLGNLFIMSAVREALRLNVLVLPRRYGPRPALPSPHCASRENWIGLFPSVSCRAAECRPVNPDLCGFLPFRCTLDRLGHSPTSCPSFPLPRSLASPFASRRFVAVSSPPWFFQFFFCFLGFLVSFFCNIPFRSTSV